MSLLDTIQGAREEAQQANAARNTSKTSAQAAEQESAKETQAAQGFSRRSTARAKPRRELAGSVSSANKPKSQMTKEEKKAAQEKRRSEEEVIYDAKKILLDQYPGYRRTQYVWWTLLLVGIALTIGSWGIMRALGANGGTENTALLSIIMMVAAYVLVIGAFIYDLVRVRPMRKKVDEQLTGMTKKRMRNVIEEDKRRKAEKKK